MTLDDIGPGSLRIVVANDTDGVEFALREWFSEEHARQLAPGVWVVFGPYELSELRDAIGPRMSDKFVFIVEFERWAGLGAHVDPTWLLRRGH